MIAQKQSKFMKPKYLYYSEKLKKKMMCINFHFQMKKVIHAAMVYQLATKFSPKSLWDLGKRLNIYF